MSNTQHASQNEIPSGEVNTLEESDIADAVSGLHLTRKPSLPHDQERLHNTEDSESEEDVTEEHIDTIHTIQTTEAPVPGPTRSTQSLETNQQPQPPIESQSNESREQENGDNAGTLPPTQQEEEEENSVAPLENIPRPTFNQNGNNRGRSSSSASPSTVSGLLPRSQRVWEMDRQAPECRRCHRRFNFLVRRHHCRRCGQIVCDKCSSNRIRLPVEELIEDPMISTSQYPLLASQSQRVCDTCYREPIRRSSESHSRRVRPSRAVPFGNQMQRSNSSQSLMIDCPVCGSTFLGMQKKEQEEHLQACLNVGSPPVQSPRYIVYELSSDSTQVGDECPICLDEFEEGDKISRMICLCSYHQKCLTDWLQRGKGCPVHYDSLLSN